MQNLSHVDLNSCQILRIGKLWCNGSRNFWCCVCSVFVYCETFLRRPRLTTHIRLFYVVFAISLSIKQFFFNGWISLYNLTIHILLTFCSVTVPVIHTDGENLNYKAYWFVEVLFFSTGIKSDAGSSGPSSPVHGTSSAVASPVRSGSAVPSTPPPTSASGSSSTENSPNINGERGDLIEFYNKVGLSWSAILWVTVTWQIIHWSVEEVTADWMHFWSKSYLYLIYNLLFPQQHTRALHLSNLLLWSSVNQKTCYFFFNSKLERANLWVIELDLRLDSSNFQ